MTLPLRLADPRPSYLVVLSLLLLVAMAASAWIARPLFLSLGVVGLVLTGYLAYHWPRTMLVMSALAVLADPVLVPAVLPSSMTFGPIGISEPMLLATSLVITYRGLRHGTFWHALRDPVVGMVILFVAVAVVSAFVNATPALVAGLGIVMTIDAIAVYVVARMLPFDQRGVAVAVGAIVGVAAAASVLGIAQVVLHPDLLGFASFAGRFGEGGRITSFLGNPNMVAAVVGFVLPFPILAAQRLPEVRHRRAAFALATLFCLALLLTFSRGAWVAVALGMLVGLMLLSRRALLILLMAVVAAWAISVVLPRNLLVSQEDLALYFPQSGAPSIIDSTLDRLDEVYEKRDLRMRFIREGLPVVLDNPVLGVGPGRYGGAAATITDSPVYAAYGTGLYGFRTVHNFWLHMTGELGAIGVAVFLTLVVGLVIRFVHAARRELDPMRFILMGGSATALVVVAFNNLTEMVFEGNFPGFVIWLVLGMVSTLAPSAPILWGRVSRSSIGGASSKAPEAPAEG
ncbi:MAG: O-antigen ligase family protein [Candidatus Limnocylindria bacterium]